MTDKEKDLTVDGEDMVVVMTDEDGNEFYYREEMIIPVDGEKYALLVGMNEDEEGHCGCGCEDEECEEDVIIAKIVTNAEGEEEYVDLTDEEFDKVQKAYDVIMDEEEAAEKE